MKTIFNDMSWDELMALESETMPLIMTQNYELWLQGYDIEDIDFDVVDLEFTPRELMEFEQDVYRHILPVDTTGLSYQDVIDIYDLPF